MQPSFALNALDYQFALDVAFEAAGARRQRSAGSALREAVHPGAVESGIVGAAGRADGAPLALPVPVGHVLQRRVHAVDVEGNVAVVAQNEAPLVVALAAAFAHGAVQAPPSFLQDYFGDFNGNAVRVVALSALHAGYEASFLVRAQGSAHNANVLR